MTKETSDETQSEPLIETYEQLQLQTQTRRRWPVWLLLLTQAITLCLLPASYLLGLHDSSSKFPQLPTHAVSKAAYKVQLQTLDDGFLLQEEKNKKFKGVPRPELDDAWNGMLQHMNIRVHPDEIRESSNFSSIELNDGSGDMMGMPTVFHGLHCLKTIRESMFPEAYPESWAKFKPPTPGGISRHMDHCIENLRQAIMCQGDLALYTYRWLPEQDEPDIVAGMQHMCVDFDTVFEWAKERSFSLNDKLLTNTYREAPWDPSKMSPHH